MSEDELEPVEADPVEADPVAEEAGEAVGAASAAAAETAVSAEREGQRLVSTQTVQHDYLTLNGKVARETIAVDGTVTTVMDFIYDESGRRFALKYSDDGGKSFDTYYYVLNLQGDVVKLVWYIPGFEYEAVASYTYDAWGNILSATGELAEINPLRYRGYYYDSETGFYYLQSRYYDPANRRFINADAYASTGQGFMGYNMFAYCLNNPVAYADYDGEDVTITIIETVKTFSTPAGTIIVSVALKKTIGDDAERQIEMEEDSMLFTFEEGDASYGISLSEEESAPEIEVVFYEAETPNGTIDGTISLSGVGFTNTTNMGHGYFLEETVEFIPNPGDNDTKNGLSDPVFSVYDSPVYLSNL